MGKGGVARKAHATVARLREFEQIIHEGKHVGGNSTVPTVWPRERIARALRLPKPPPIPPFVPPRPERNR